MIKLLHFILCGLSWASFVGTDSVIFIGVAVVITLSSLDLIINYEE